MPRTSTKSAPLPYLEAPLDNLHAVMRARDELRRLLDPSPADSEG
jgi:hypothetical protein